MLVFFTNKSARVDKRRSINFIRLFQVDVRSAHRARRRGPSKESENLTRLHQLQLARSCCDDLSVALQGFYHIIETRFRNFFNLLAVQRFFRLPGCSFYILRNFKLAYLNNSVFFLDLQIANVLLVVNLVTLFEKTDLFLSGKSRTPRHCQLGFFQFSFRLRA